MDICQRIYTTHDTNGNARAIWLAYNVLHSASESAVGQGYLETGGNRPAQLRGWSVLSNLEVTPRQYLEIVRNLKRQGKLTP